MEEDEGTVIEKHSWSLDLRLEKPGRSPVFRNIVATSQRLKLPPVMSESASTWMGSSSGIGTETVRYISELKKTGQDNVLITLLRAVDARLSGIELLAPDGAMAELYVRLEKESPLLPVSLMGEGFQRCFELGATAAVDHWPTIFVDEIENGMHHLVLDALWQWIAMISRKRNLQVFATTHSEECIYAACHAFGVLGDDGLRVIRLDRLDGSTRAAVYDQTLVETAERTGTELRG